MKNVIMLLLMVLGIAIAVFGTCAIIEYHFGLEYVALIAVILAIVLAVYAAYDAIKDRKNGTDK